MQAYAERRRAQALQDVQALQSARDAQGTPK
jgi:hypothetical protein